MSASTVIGDVTLTLEELLKSEQQSEVSFDVTHNSPTQEAEVQSTQARVNVYLFGVMENPHAKNQSRQAIGSERLRKPPLTLNLQYIVTPFAADELDEQRILGEAMRIMYDNAIVTAPLLKGGLEHTSEELRIDLCAFNLEELARVWHAADHPFRLSVCYEVRIVSIDSVTEQSVTRVLEKENQFR